MDVKQLGQNLKATGIVTYVSTGEKPGFRFKGFGFESYVRCSAEQVKQIAVDDTVRVEGSIRVFDNEPSFGEVHLLAKLQGDKFVPVQG